MAVIDALHNAPSTAATVLDGGMGRELERIGAPFRQPEWSALALIEAPEFVTRVHEAFIDAGADVITTNSYALVPFHIGEQRFRAQGRDLIALSGRLARAAADAAGRTVRVAGSLPPVCGSYRADWFDAEVARPLLEALTESLRPHIDHWQAETLSAVEEAELARAVIGDDLRPLWLSFTLRDADARMGDPRLRSGQTVAEAVAAARRLRAMAVLFNCSQPEVMGDAIDVARESMRGIAGSALAIGVYANAFAPQTSQAQANDGLSEIRSDLDPRGYLRWVDDWLARGATIVGGCCGIGPEHIRLIRERVR